MVGAGNVLDLNRPTLEPAITPGNELLIAAALAAASVPVPASVDQAAVDALFREDRHRGKKGEFAFALAAALASAQSVVVPQHVNELFDFLFLATAAVEVTTT